MKLTPRSDDIWQWAMLVLKRTAVKRVMNSHHDLVSVGTAHNDHVDSLYEANRVQTEGLRVKDLQLRRVMEHYPEMLDILRDG